VKGDPVPEAHHVARHCRATDLIITNGVPTGVTEAAFQLRPDETDGLSAIWLEFFGNEHRHNVAGVRSVTKLTVKRSHRIAILNVGQMTSLAPLAGLSVLEDPVEDLAPHTNAAHVLIKDPGLVMQKNQGLRDALAFLVLPGDLETY
jgi:hypothetical protein